MLRPETPDEELLRAAATRPDAFGTFYRRHLRAVLAFLVHRTGNREIAADLCAEVFAAALEGAERYDPSRAPARAWLFGIAQHKLQESWRRGQVESAARQRLGMPVRELTDDDLARVEELADLHRRGGLAGTLVDGLPADQRAAIVARVLDERDYRDIARELRCSEAVSASASRAGSRGCARAWEISSERVLRPARARPRARRRGPGRIAHRTSATARSASLVAVPAVRHSAVHRTRCRNRGRDAVRPARERDPGTRVPRRPRGAVPGCRHVPSGVAARRRSRAGQPPWAIRVARSRTGFLCSTVGQVVDGQFGLTGMDGKFRLLPERIVDSCGETRTNAASLVGVRVFDAKRRTDLRSVVYGIAGPTLKEATIVAGGQTRAAELTDGGLFLVSLQGLPEDIGVRVSLRFEDGHTETHPFGISPFVTPDPAGGAAWRTQSGAFGVRPGDKPDLRTCVWFRPAREVHNPAVSPAACGVLANPRHPTGYFFTARRIERGTGGIPVEPFGEGRWGNHPPLTGVWGAVGEDVKRVEVTGPGGLTRTPVLPPNRAFLALFPPDVDPAGLRVRLTFADGHTETHAGNTNLVSGAPRR